MSSRLTRILQKPFYPCLFAIYPVLHLYSTNLGLVKDQEVLTCVQLMLAATVLVLVATRAIVGSQHKAAFLVSELGLFFSLSGHLYEIVLPYVSALYWTAGVLLVAAIVTAELVKLPPPKFFLSATPVLNLIASVLVLGQIPVIAAYYASNSSGYLSVLQGHATTDRSRVSAKVLDSLSRPDIYYIIPDGYPSDAWLRDAMNFDNSAFTQALEKRGFEINELAQSNYGATLVSLASTLNVTYMASNPSPFADTDYFRSSISDSKVAQTLQQLGYTYVQLLSGYLVPSLIADISRDFTPAGTVDIEHLPNALYTRTLENANGINHRLGFSSFYKRPFLPLYLDTTLLRAFGNELIRFLGQDVTAPYDMFAPERFLATIDELESIVAMPEATFTVVHLLKPHRPTVFDEHGKLIGIVKRPSPQEHLAELRFINSKFLAMIDTILEGSNREPIIIFQADHGSLYGSTRTDDGRLIHFDAYSAYRLSEDYTIEVPRPFTFINTFPLLLNTVFDADLGLLDNRLIELLEGNTAPFEQVDVTEIYRHK